MINNLFILVVGFVIFRGSNSQKNSFRNNPYDPALARKHFNDIFFGITLFKKEKNS